MLNVISEVIFMSLCSKMCNFSLRMTHIFKVLCAYLIVIDGDPDLLPNLCLHSDSLFTDFFFTLKHVNYFFLTCSFGLRNWNLALVNLSLKTHS